MLAIQDILFSQGFGTRRVCAGLVQQGLVSIEGRTLDDAAEMLEATGLAFSVQGQIWHYQAQAYLMLHKPAGHECSQKPGAWPSIYTLLPGPIRQRGGGAAAGVQAVGRLDQDTTGLLLLSDDGKFIHRMSSPRHHVPKVYELVTIHPVTAAHHMRLTLTEGKYHQVKRMLAAVGNRVEQLHRSRIGGLALPADLSPGQWRWLSEADLLSISASSLAQV